MRILSFFDMDFISCWYDLLMIEEYVKDFEAWNAYKRKLDKNEFKGFFRAREIWWCSLGVNIGSEQDGKNELFERPVLVIRKMRFDQLALVAPISTKINDQTDRIDAYIMGEKSQVLLSQIRVVSRRRFLKKYCILSKDTFNTVIIRLAMMILDSEECETPPLRRGITEPEGIVGSL